MNVLLYLGIFWTIYGLAGLLGWQRINNKYKGYDWTKKYIRCLGISWLMLGIPCLIFSRLYEAGYNTRSMFVLMCFCMLPSLIFTIVVEKKFNAKSKTRRDKFQFVELPKLRSKNGFHLFCLVLQSADQRSKYAKLLRMACHTEKFLLYVRN